MADFLKITAMDYRGASTDTKPTGVPNGTTCRETDTQALYITYDNGVTWVLADKRVRLVEEDGTFIDLPGEFATLVTALQQFMEVSIDTGLATGGSNTTIVDTTKSWETNMWADATFEVIIAGKGYLGKVVSNTATTLTIAALAGGALVVATCPYQLKRPVEIADIGKWGGTTLTGRNISLDLKALIDDSVKGVLKSIGDIDTGENLVTRIGETDSALVDAGAVGDLSAKIRRLTTDMGDALTRIGEVQASPTENTVLERLKAIETAVDAVATAIALLETLSAEITKWGGTALTGRDITGDLQSLTTVADTGLLKSIGDVAAGESLIARVGETSDALVDAGAVGSVSAKLRRATQGLEDLKTTIVLATGTNVIGSVNDNFGGNTYCKTMTMSDDNPTRFETSAKKIRDCVILVETFPMLMGETGVVVYPVAVGDRLGFTKIDLSTLYFQNAGAGNNGKITILGVEE